LKSTSIPGSGLLSGFPAPTFLGFKI